MTRNILSFSNIFNGNIKLWSQQEADNIKYNKIERLSIIFFIQTDTEV